MAFSDAFNRTFEEKMKEESEMAMEERETSGG